MRAQLQYFDGRSHQVLRLREAITIGGRGGAIRVEGFTITREHARLFEEHARWWIEDLDGDGVRINGVTTKRSVLTNRDKLQIGPLHLEYFEE